MKFLKKIQYNAPVVLTFVFVSFAVLVLNTITNGYTNTLFFSVYRSPVLSPVFWIRLIGHVLGHADFNHYTSNILMLLLVGPILEERYGSKVLLAMMTIVAVITGLVNIILFPGTALLGASGIVFMMIIMASVVGMKKGEIPLTLIIVAAIYLGQEIYGGIFGTDNVSQLTHIVGGICGAIFGLLGKRDNS